MREELEFLMAVPRKAGISSGDLHTIISRGFLKGFIDLCLNSGGKWWVVDWKTNVPPAAESTGLYGGETLELMMSRSHYHLQYELYLLALCRTLSGSRGEAVNWEEEIGGAAYLFVRGTRESDSRGVFTAKPSLERMLTLASAMGLEGVVK
jgi:exodeoxyribonuclease V beta subunit